MEGTSEQKYHEKCVVLVASIATIKKIATDYKKHQNDGELYMKLSY